MARHVSVAAFVRAAAVAAAMLMLGAAFAACGETEEELPPTAATATTSPPPTPSPSHTPPTTASATVLPGWKEYSDSVTGFSLQHPADLEFKDLTGPTNPDGMNQRVVEFRSPENPARAIAISISANPNGLPLKEWAIQFAACVPDTISETHVGEASAVICTSDALIPGPAAVIAHRNSVYYISTTKVERSEFEQLLASLRL